MLVGHTQVRSAIDKLIAEDRLPHAILFLGPQAIGKYLVALECAEKILKTKAPHPDLHIFESQDIDSLRALLSRLHLKPFMGSSRVVILRDVDDLGIGSLNLLLKTLEEPLDSTYFFLTATQGMRLPRTIVSRAQCYQFNLLSDEEILLVLSEKGITNNLLLQGSFALLDQDESSILPSLEGILRGHYLELIKFLLELDKKEIDRVIQILVSVLRREMLLEGPHQKKFAEALHNLLFAEILINQRNINPNLALSSALVCDENFQDSFRTVGL